MKLIYKAYLNKLIKKYNFDIPKLLVLISEMKAPSQNEKQEFLEYIKSKTRKDDEN